MRWVRSDGRTLTVREVGGVDLALRAEGPYPLPIADALLDDDAARRLVRDLMDTERYRRTT